MKKTDALIKAVAILLFCAMVCYLGLTAYRRFSDPVRTAMAVTATVSDTASMSGIAVREEQVVTGSEPYIDVTASEGEKIAAGGSVATIYSSAVALDRALQARALELEINQVSTALETVENEGVLNRDESIYAEIVCLSADVRSRNFSDADACQSALEGLMLRGSSDATAEHLQALKEQYDALTAVSAGETIPICVSEGGTFSSAVDGFEDVTPQQAAGMTPDALRDLADSKRSAPKNVIGKIVTSYNWYYAAVIDEQSAEKLSEGETVQLSFDRHSAEALDAEVQSIGDEQAGERTVLFSLDRGMEDMLAARSISAELVFEEHTGLRVPLAGLWRYWAGYLSRDDAAAVAPGDEVTISLDGETKNAFVSEIGGADDQGRCVAVVYWPWDESDRPADAARASIALTDGSVFTADSYYTDGEDHLCVFTVTGLQAERKKVTMVCKGDEYCLVSSEGDDALREGNEIVVSAGKMFNGKVFD